MKSPSNFEGLVLGCMDSYDSDQRLILQGFSRSTRFTNLCTLESKWKKPWKTTPWTPHEKTPLQSVARAKNTAPANKQVTQRRPMEGVASEAK